MPDERGADGAGPARFAAALSAVAPRLDVALAELAAFGRAGVDADAVVGRLDELAGACRGATPDEVCASLFGELGFRGDDERYHDPRNSLLDQVLDRRRGMPITLAALAVEVGRRRGVPLVGVGMPGHFLLRAGDEPDRFFDAFDRGRELDRDGCATLFRRLHGPAAPFEDRFLTPVGTLEVVVRVLNNLGASYLRDNDRDGRVRVEWMRSVLPGAGLPERRRLAAAVAATGRFDEAALRFDELAGSDDELADEHRRTALQLRARLN